MELREGRERVELKEGRESEWLCLELRRGESEGVEVEVGVEGGRGRGFLVEVGLRLELGVSCWS